ncbi:import inner membrane translocase subunit tim23-related [Anaeramoeba ignava]|uniref:Import inner membrane translocase subunit tim23-related n=1 Tax=Anaeramoeba ignava TaxID=1746090 RepID=A0A9Q0R6F9_ANAIG|nr:import inner membrane translocase subunit tim23-related [Anaeramoeba ignava]
MDQIEKFFQIAKEKTISFYEKIQKSNFHNDFEMIGKSYLIGLGIGFLEGTRQTIILPEMKGEDFLKKVWLSSMDYGQKLGMLSISYCLMKNSIKQIRENDDEINHVLAGAGTGLLYQTLTSKSFSSKLLGLAFGSGIGLVVAKKDTIDWDDIPGELNKFYHSSIDFSKKSWNQFHQQNPSRK